jgi:hypothetical protein
MTNCQTLITDGNPLMLPCTFTAQFLAVEVLETNKPPTWFKAGYLKAFVDVAGQTYLVKKLTIGFDRQIIDMPYFSYTLSFQREYWLLNTLIKIKELTAQEASILMPLYSPMPTTIGDQPVLDSVPTTFSAPQYLVATLAAAYQALAANTARQKFAVRNTGTVPVYLDMDAPAALNKGYVVIPAGGTYISDFDYQGAVFIWSSNATAQACEVRELLQ